MRIGDGEKQQCKLLGATEFPNTHTHKKKYLKKNQEGGGGNETPLLRRQRKELTYILNDHKNILYYSTYWLENEAG